MFLDSFLLSCINVYQNYSVYELHNWSHWIPSILYLLHSILPSITHSTHSFIYYYSPLTLPYLMFSAFFSSSVHPHRHFSAYPPSPIRHPSAPPPLPYHSITHPRHLWSIIITTQRTPSAFLLSPSPSPSPSLGNYFHYICIIILISHRYPYHSYSSSTYYHNVKNSGFFSS